MAGLSGLVAAGVDQSLMDVLDRRLKEALRQQDEKQHADTIAMARERTAMDQQDRNTDNERQMKLVDLAQLQHTDVMNQAATDRNVGSDAANVIGMPGMSKEDQARELTQSALRNPNSKATPGILKVIEGLQKVDATKPPVRHVVGGNLVDDSGQVLFKAPEKTEKPEKVDKEWVMRGGKPVQIPKGTAAEGDTPYDATAVRQTNAAAVPSPYSLEREQRVLQSVDELTKKVGNSTVGLGSLLGNIPATDARNFKSELDTLKANIAFNELAQMRASSKTGGALGQVSDREGTLLQSTLGALDTGQSPENFKQQLLKIRGSIERWQKAKHAAESQSIQNGATVTLPPKTDGDHVDALIKKYGGKPQ